MDISHPSMDTTKLKSTDISHLSMDTQIPYQSIDNSHRSIDNSNILTEQVIDHVTITIAQTLIGMSELSDTHIESEGHPISSGMTKGEIKEGSTLEMMKKESKER